MCVYVGGGRRDGNKEVSMGGFRGHETMPRDAEVRTLRWTAHWPGALNWVPALKTCVSQASVDNR